MIVADATTKSLEIKLGGAVTTAQLPFVSSYVDINQTTLALTGSKEADGVTNDATGVTVMAAPAATTSRKLNYLSVYNIDTVPAIVTVSFNNNATLRISWRGTLAVGDTLSYVDGRGFNVTDVNGQLKTANTTTGLTSLTTGVSGILPGGNGGTGVNNGVSTITIGGSVTVTGAFSTTITVTGTTTVTLPTSGTLVTTTVTALTALASVGTITTGVWNGTVVGATYGGTGVNNGASTITIGGSVTFTGAFTTAVTVTGNTAVTLPTSGTLLSTAAAVTVAQGGTGLATLTTAYGLVAAGTTATGALQNVGVGTAGYTLTSGGAAALPAYVAHGAPIVSALTDGATPALNAALGTVFTLAAAGDRTIAVPSNPTNGQKIVIRHLASGGARTLALNTGAGGFRFGTDITALTATASGKTDYIGCIYSSIDSKWDVIAVVKGY